MVTGLRMELAPAKQPIRRSPSATWRLRAERLRYRILRSGELAECAANTAQRAAMRVDRPAASDVSVRDRVSRRKARIRTDLLKSREPFLWVRVRRRGRKSEAACHVAPSPVGSDLRVESFSDDSLT